MMNLLPSSAYLFLVFGTFLFFMYQYLLGEE